MKIIDEYWEKRNLGVETVKVEIDTEDLVEQCREKLWNIKESYQVVQVPAGMISMQHMLEEENFLYMEAIIRLRHDLKTDNMNSVQRRLLESITYAKMDAQDIKQLFNEIENGIFTTDRVYLDPVFSKEQVVRRYNNWIQDEIDRGANAYKYIYKNEAVGFCLIHEEGKNGYAILGGMYTKYLDSGIGTVNVHIPLKIEKDRKMRYFYAGVSTNNMPSLRNAIEAGFKIISIENIFVKHLDDHKKEFL